jgi:hypothetical protein
VEESVVAAAAEGKEVLDAGNFTGDGISFFLSFFLLDDAIAEMDR